MPNVETTHFGQIEFEEASVVIFPAGLPGFEERRRFLPLQFTDSAPLVFLQSVEVSGLCFVTVPIQAVDREYQLHVSEEDLESIGLDANRQPTVGSETLCLAVLSIRETGPTANLLAPVLINTKNRLAVQAMQEGCGYSHQYVLQSWEEVASPC
jgi:flagellar assembly factor FliW